MSLDYELDELRDFMKSTVDAVTDFISSVEERPVVQATDAKKLRAQLSEAMPTRAMPMDDILQEMREKVLNNATMTYGPNYHAYVASGGNHAGVIAEMISAALVQNGAKWHLSPIAVEMERLTSRWIAKFIGYREDCAGVFTSGGSMANQVGLTVARNVKAPWDVKKDGLAGHRQLIIYASDETHSCVIKSANVLGIGTKGIRTIPTLPNGTIDVAALDDAIEHDWKRGVFPFCVVANAGTVNTGAVDPINDLADICRKHDLWLHVDGAYGVVAAAVGEYKDLFAGLDRADSIAVVPHKWLYVPVEDGVILVRNADDLRNTYKQVPAYLDQGRENGRFELNEHSFELSRSFKSLKVWATFKAYGADGLRNAIAKNINDVQECADYIRSRRNFELIEPVNLSIVCFRYLGDTAGIRENENSLNALNRLILEKIERDGRMFLTGTTIEGKTVLRMCNINHRTTVEDLRNAVKIAAEIGKQCEQELVGMARTA